MSVMVFACSQKETANKFVIGFSQCNSAEPWRETMNKEMLATAAQYPGIELIISDAQQDNSRQVAEVENFIIKEVDLLIISPNEAQPLTAIVEKVYRQGIPVIVLDRSICRKLISYFGVMVIWCYSVLVEWRYNTITPKHQNT